MSDSEQESYNIDEMMRRLRARGEAGPEGEPQLVTRPDGTQVYRVRKRKRRSRQPKKEAEARRRRSTIVWISVFCVLVFALLISGVAWILYLNGGTYQDEVAKRVSAWTGAETTLKSFGATPFRVRAGGMELQWPDERSGARLVAKNIEGGVGALGHLSGVWEGDVIRADEAWLTVPHAAEGAGSTVPAGPVPFQSSFRVGKLSVKLGPEGKPGLVFSGGSASLSVPDADRAKATVVIEGGSVRLSEWGNFDVRIASLGLGPEGVRIGSLVLSPGEHDRSQIRLTGDDSGREVEGAGSQTYDLEVKDVPAFVLLGSGLGGIFEGSFSSPDGDKRGTLRFDPSKLSSLEFELPVVMANTTENFVRRLPLLAGLVELTDSPRFGEPRLGTKEPMVVRRHLGGDVELTDINLVAKDTLGVKGDLKVGPNGELEGTLEIGLHESVAGLYDKQVIAAVFPKTREGFVWAEVRVSGTALHPMDDLTARIKAAKNGVSPATGGAGSLDDEFRELTDPGR